MTGIPGTATSGGGFPAPGDDVPGAPPALEGPDDRGAAALATGPLSAARLTPAPRTAQAAPTTAPAAPAPERTAPPARSRVAAAVAIGLALAVAGVLLARRRSGRAGSGLAGTGPIGYIIP